ncbi:MAG TPA: winged helix-turn-helix domain-containing protein [Nitrososphaerales archaeon]|nr:winged helix-turn-helix domain-containing protein [Nitrososphaerales archaeon]
MSQETIPLDKGRGAEEAWRGRLDSRFHETLEGRPHDGQQTLTHGFESSCSILRALGDDSSRRILAAAIPSGKTVEEIGAEENLPLSTCYRRIRELLDEGLMVMERLVVTKAGKRYAIYRTAFSEVKVRFASGGVEIQAAPNLEVIEKVRAKYLEAQIQTDSQAVDFWRSAVP